MPPRLTIARDSYSKNLMCGDGTLDHRDLHHPLQRLTAPVGLRLVRVLVEPAPRVRASQLDQALRELVREEQVAQDLAAGRTRALARQAAEYRDVAERAALEAGVCGVREPADRIRLGRDQ